MNSIERVCTALSHKEPDKVPKGELDIHGELIQKILNIQREPTFEDHVAVRKKLKIDLVCISGYCQPDYVDVYAGLSAPVEIGKDSSGHTLLAGAKYGDLEIE